MSATESSTEILRRMLDERGVEYDGRLLYETEWTVNGIAWHAKECDGMLNVYVRNNDLMLTPEQAIAASLGRQKAKAHPYGYECDTGAYDCTRCECGCINDISATYCNDCGGEIEIDESAEKEYYDGYSKHTVFAKKHDDGSLEFCERRYVPEESVTHGTLTAKQVMAIAGKHQPDYCSDTHVCFDWQAIADELNAAMGTGECETYRDEYGVWHCSSCEKGADKITGSDGALESWNDSWPPNFCPMCGARIRKAVER